MILLPAYYSLLGLLLTILLRVTQRRGDIWTDGIIITGLSLLLFLLTAIRTFPRSYSAATQLQLMYSRLTRTPPSSFYARPFVLLLTARLCIRLVVFSWWSAFPGWCRSVVSGDLRCARVLGSRLAALHPGFLDHWPWPS